MESADSETHQAEMQCLKTATGSTMDFVTDLTIDFVTVTEMTSSVSDTTMTSSSEAGTMTLMILSSGRSSGSLVTMTGARIGAGATRIRIIARDTCL